ncbi:hypothetical protein KAU11_01125 [Candidatus Babeliales bacterium]|nr:hypothetical protein [Candidatus Babeliales bacterium]
MFLKIKLNFAEGRINTLVSGRVLLQMFERFARWQEVKGWQSAELCSASQAICWSFQKKNKPKRHFFDIFYSFLQF